MAITLRTDSASVQAVLAAGQDYDLANAPDLNPYMRAASLLVSRVAACASVKGYGLSSDEQTEMEAWLAAYFYTRSDPIYQSKSTGGQSASFAADQMSSVERYKAGAMALDPSGCLDAILNNKRARGAWLGKTVDEQLTWEERNGRVDF